MASRQRNLLGKFMAIVLVIATPLAQAQSTFPGPVRLSSDVSKLRGLGQPVWDLAARKVFEDEGIDPVPVGEMQELSRYFFADYLGYLNAIGIELASAENTIKGKKEIKDLGECSKKTLDDYNQILTNSIESDLDTFTNSYCNSACRQKAEFEFGLIATFAQPEGYPETCADKAKEMYDEYHCDELGSVYDSSIEEIPGIGTSDRMILNPDNRHTSLPDFRGGGTGLLPRDIPALRGMDMHIDSSLSVRGGFKHDLPRTLPVMKIPDLKSRIDIDSDFKSILSKKKKRCAKEQSDLLRKTFAEPDGSTTTSRPGRTVRDPLDPRWTTWTEEKSESDDELPAVHRKNPVCKFSEPELKNHFSELRKAYSRISREKISASLGHWPIFDEEGRIVTGFTRAITWTADRFFGALIDDLEAQHGHACGTGRISMISDTTETTIIDGRRYLLTIRSGKDGKPEDTDASASETERTEPATVATYFSANSSVAEALVNGMFGASSVGAATHSEIRAGEIASGVRRGSISSADIGSEAAKGRLGSDAKRIEELTRQYLEQGNYQGLKVFAAEVMGGLIAGGGSAITVAGVKKIGTMFTSSGRISALFMAARGVIMRPFLFGTESGAVNWGIKILQTGGATLEERTAISLNKYFNRNLNKREWGRALERLKAEMKIRNSHHGKILSNGDYLDTNGRLIGNIFDYL